MALPKEESEGAHVLPRPELNPLLNPLLAENMGRWAEVYFTAAPDKREEAVLELLRKLEAGGSGPESGAKSQPSAAPANLPFTDAEFPMPSFSAADFVGDKRQPQHCDACGHNNPDTHQFCGMCGEKLSPEDTTEDLPPIHRPADPPSMFLDPSNSNNLEAAPLRKSRMVRDIALNQRYGEEVGETDELARLRRISKSDTDAPVFSWVEPSPSRRYGVYVGVGLVVVVVLAYLAWLGSLTSRAHNIHHDVQVSGTDVGPAPPTASTLEAPPAIAPPTQAASAPPVATVRDNPETKPPERSAIKTVSDKKLPLTVQPASLGNGDEELAIAQRYLNGGTGLQRNSAEAAQWLWKSIAKHNSSATLLLADLYLRGEGVSKNCDQARVLLDSAARKGVEGAGERLRNLQAFGCQ